MLIFKKKIIMNGKKISIGYIWLNLVMSKIIKIINVMILFSKFIDNLFN